MPPGLPTPQQLLDGEVTFVSLDTQVIQSAGYDFSKGALNQLPKQLPSAMKLQLAEVVLREVVGHRLVPVKKAADQFMGAISSLNRLTGLDFAPASAHFDNLKVLSATQDRFETEIRQYVKQCRGEVLPIGDVDIDAVFTKYFAVKPPFGVRADKKSEFPDAVALHLLEQYASGNGTKGICASADGGWKSFAEKSEHLYCAGTLDELAALFSATDAHAQGLRQKLATAAADENSALRAKLSESLRDHLQNADWDADELYNGARRIEPEVTDVELASYIVEQDSLNVWQVDGEPGAWVVELTARAQVDVTVSVQFFVWDSIDREELPFGSDSFTFTQEVAIDAYLTCYSVKLDSPPESWDIDVEIGLAKYSLSAAEVEPDFSDQD